MTLQELDKLWEVKMFDFNLTDELKIIIKKPVKKDKKKVRIIKKRLNKLLILIHNQ
jgi:hypothetical protein